MHTKSQNIQCGVIKAIYPLIISPRSHLSLGDSTRAPRHQLRRRREQKQADRRPPSAAAAAAAAAAGRGATMS